MTNMDEILLSILVYEIICFVIELIEQRRDLDD